MFCMFWYKIIDFPIRSQDVTTKKRLLIWKWAICRIHSSFQIRIFLEMFSFQIRNQSFRHSNSAGRLPGNPETGNFPRNVTFYVERALLVCMISSYIQFWLNMTPDDSSELFYMSVYFWGIVYSCIRFVVTRMNVDPTSVWETPPTSDYGSGLVGWVFLQDRH